MSEKHYKLNVSELKVRWNIIGRAKMGFHWVKVQDRYGKNLGIREPRALSINIGKRTFTYRWNATKWKAFKDGWKYYVQYHLVDYKKDIAIPKQIAGLLMAPADILEAKDATNEYDLRRILTQLVMVAEARNEKVDGLSIANGEYELQDVKFRVTDRVNDSSSYQHPKEVANPPANTIIEAQ